MFVFNVRLTRSQNDLSSPLLVENARNTNGKKNGLTLSNFWMSLPKKTNKNQEVVMSFHVTTKISENVKLDIERNFQN